MTTKQIDQEESKKRKRKELKALGFIIVVLFPMLSVFAVGGYGLIIWLMQIFGGVTPH
ncbi:trimethylamine N-oxide reductase system protein TorE [Colwellia sp. 75C3]|uniref:trimethylamine N-oxide reductase system protein TorE n=1 Tax=Colwellia sp. 75C3 TaxID=888425 RepID=UPI000C343E4F|nr:trimethylamine N-oxide reductase system protein TorE [Colwellia sp. 75C3]PKG82026.1 trimethylamine N-oxide reductase system protein TorE [Colwellia sp. 75C3]